jgi:4,5-dihydroxyphthalate decarboxylase
MFPNYRELEMAYYKRSGMFPIMRLIGIKKELAERYRWLPASVFKAFCQAKKVAVDEMKEMPATITLPWPEAYVQDAVRLKTLSRYWFEQGLSTRQASAAEIFHPSVFEISKV